MRKAAAGVLLAASALCAGTASAQSTAQVSISDFSWSLVDLNPNDGIDPSLTFLAPNVAQSSSGTVTLDAGTLVSDARMGGAAFAPLSVYAGNPFGNVRGSISGAPGAGFAISTSGDMDTTGTLSSQLSTGYLGFVLSPMTAVTFSSRAVVELGLDLPSGVTGGGTSGVARMNVNADVGGFPEYFGDTAALSTTGGPQSLDRILTVTVANVSGAVNNNELEFSTSINGQLTSPVPEPSTWAMFLGGLALLAGHARLRQRAGRRS